MSLGSFAGMRFLVLCNFVLFNSSLGCHAAR
jgi:hypothetical protein